MNFPSPLVVQISSGNPTTSSTGLVLKFPLYKKILKFNFFLGKIHMTSGSYGSKVRASLLPGLYKSRS